MSSSKKRARKDDQDDMDNAVSGTSSSKKYHENFEVEEEMEEDKRQQAEAKVIQDEYKVWKKNTPFLYDIVMSHALEWPSLTCQWFPDQISPPEKDYTVQRLLLGTQTSGAESNYLLICDVKLPSSEAVVDAREFSTTKETEAGGYGGASGKIEIVQRIPHDLDVNRARYNPHNPDLLATRSAGPLVFIFDRTNHPSKPLPDATPNPDLVLEGHTAEGFGICWSTVDEGKLITCGEDSAICVWDIQGITKDKKSLKPFKTITSPNDGYIGDVQYHPLQAQIFGTASDDMKVKLYDLRLSSSSLTHTFATHTGAVNSLAFNPFNHNLLASGGTDTNLLIWDMRNQSKPLHTLPGHSKDIGYVSWSPFSEDVLASSAKDRRINVWNLDAVNDEEKKYDSNEEEDDTPSGLLFVHGGHTDNVGEFSWHGVRGEEWVIASVADDNILQVWQMAENIYNEDEEGDGEDEEGDAEERKQRKEEKED